MTIILFFHLKAKGPRYGHFLHFTSTVALVNLGGESLEAGCEFKLVTLDIFKSTHLLPPDQICTSHGKNEGMASQKRLSCSSRQFSLNFKEDLPKSKRNPRPK